MGQQIPHEHAFTIAQGASLSNAIPVKGETVIGIRMNGSWTAAGLGLHVSYDGGITFVSPDIVADLTTLPYVPVEWEIAAAYVGTTPNFYLVIPDVLVGLGATHVKVSSQTSGSGVTQGAARSGILVTRDTGL